MSAACQQVDMKKQNTPTSIGEKAYQYLRGKILSGEFSPGTALSEASLARELGNSRGPLREAVRRLTGEGFLQQTPSGGRGGVDFSRRYVSALFRVRAALVLFAVRKTAKQHMSSGD